MAFAESLARLDTWSLVTFLVSSICLYPVASWIYNVLFHPLASFPGPLTWRASRLPYMRAAWSGRFPYAIQDLHKQYGDIVRTAPNELSFRNPVAWDDIYSNSNGAKAFPKSELWHGNPEGGASSVFVTPDPKSHARIRRYLDPAFSERAVLQQQPILHKYVDLCVDKLRERCAANNGKVTVNIINWLDFTLLDIIGDLSFGESFDCLQKCEYEDWMSNMAGMIKLHFLSINLRYYPIITAMMKPLSGVLIPKETIKQLMDHRQRATAKLDRRLKSDINRPDIVSQLLRSEDKGEGLTHDEVVENSMLFINAASETTATSLTEMTLEALKDLPYLNAVLKEGLRMSSPTPVGNIRIVPPQGGMVDGHFVPGHTMVTIPQVAIAFAEENFHEPYGWHPERWLPEAETDPKSPFYHDKRKAIRAFGYGQYNCVGEPLAWAQMRLLVAKLVWSFQMTLASTPNAKIEWDKQDVFAIIFKDPLDVTFIDRSG